MLQKIDSLLTIGSVLFTVIVPYLLDAGFSSEFYQNAMSLVSLWARFSAALHFASAIFETANWIIKHRIESQTALAAAVFGGTVSAFAQVLLLAARPVSGSLLGAGSSYLNAVGLNAYREAEAQNKMPIQDWCTKYGGCSANS